MSVPTPECDKVSVHREDATTIGDFLEWLMSHKKLTICHHNPDACSDENSWYPANIPIQSLLAEYFKIDLDQVEKERLAMLEELRTNQESPLMRAHNREGKVE